jgi:hypothetical protein
MPPADPGRILELYGSESNEGGYQLLTVAQGRPGFFIRAYRQLTTVRHLGTAMLAKTDTDPGA